MKACSDIDFLDSYWREAKRIAAHIEENLAKGVGEERQRVNSSSGVRMYIVNFTDLKDNWSAGDVIGRTAGQSLRLQALADKIVAMIHKGNADSVKPMVEKICTGRIKKLSKPDVVYSGGTEFLGHGHFRWNNQAYTLDPVELKRLKEFFKL